MKRLVLFVAFVLSVFAVQAQASLIPTAFTADMHNTRDTLPNVGILLQSENDGGHYPEGIDRWYTVFGGCVNPQRLVFKITAFDIDASDTLYIYDGVDTNAPLLAMGNNDFSNLRNRFYFLSAGNTNGCLTVRFKSNIDGHVGGGFQIHMYCDKPCESVVPVIENNFYRTRNGEIYDTVKAVNVITYDSVTGEPNGSYISVNMCMGDGLILKGHGEYTYYTGYYTPSDETTLFTWAVSTGDEVVEPNHTTFEYDGFVQKSCYEVSLKLIDEQGCGGDMVDIVRIRVSTNPIESIAEDLAVFCNDTNILLTTSVSQDSITTTLIINPTPSDVVTKTNEVKTFIPDGPYCSVPCYQAPVEFTEFPAGRTITSADDICSICINYEHSYMGDYDLSIVCPTGAKSVLKYKNLPSPNLENIPSDGAGGGGTYTGYPFGGSSDGTYDNHGGGGYCDSIYNMYGVGLEYCFSRNENYTLVSGMPANTANTTAGHYLASYGQHSISVTYDFGQIPPPYHGAGTNVGTSTFSTKQPSNHEEKLDYYKPAQDFSQLIGCPMNGIWSIEICDTWEADNGWVFSWSMDICGVDNPVDCQYTVAIDSIRWSPDYSVGGIVAKTINNDSTYIYTPDTAGSFPVVAHVYDEFGCVWDTLTHIKTAWTPKPFIGNDTSICDPESVVLDATDPHHDDGDFVYSWEPFGENTPVINTQTWMGHDTNYIVTVVNKIHGLSCTGSDTMTVHVFPVPIPGFLTNIVPAAGCSPFDIQFVDTAKYGYEYFWRFGDGFTSTDRNPRHLYSAGRYDVTQIVTTDFGCVDSLTKPQYVWVFHTPDAQFTWEPEYPTFNSPRIQLINQTYPMVSDNIYEWYIQSDASGENFQKAYSLNPVYTWQAPLTAGDYRVRLDARTENYDQDGNLLVCRDSVETTVMLIQDFLQFPTAITPNGDGINDKFVIHGLIDGLAYPNNTLHIYNRWGAMVYSKDNVRLDEDCWDPQAERAPAGTYFYYFNAHGYLGNIQRTGSVEVMNY